MIKIHVGRPDEFTRAEIDSFIAMGIESREVDPDRLPELVGEAFALAFLFDGDDLAAIAGLKNPRHGYRAKVASKSRVEIDPASYLYELGWVYAKPGHEGGKSLALCAALMERSRAAGVFSTSREVKLPMHATLSKLKFERVGDTWPSKENDGAIALFVRPPSLARKA